LIIRQARPDDAGIVLDYFRMIQAERLGTILRHDRIPDLDEERAYIEARTGERGVALICLDEKAVAGMLVADRKQHPQLKHSCSFGIGILEKYRNQGVGTRLIAALMGWAGKRRLKRVELTVVASNTSAIRLYERLGFVTEGTKRGAVKVGRKYVDFIEMVKRI